MSLWPEITPKMEWATLFYPKLYGFRNREEDHALLEIWYNVA